MAACSAVQEMVLQSYGGVIRIFPAIPRAWKDASFYGLRADGAFIVSASKRAGNIDRLEIKSEKGGILSVDNPFGKEKINIKADKAFKIKAENDLLKWDCKPGAKVVIERI